VRTPHRGACAMSRQWLQGGDDRPSWATLTRRARGRAVQHDVLSDSVAGCSLRLSMPSLQATANAAMIFAMLKPMPMPSAARTEPHVRNLPSALLRCRLSASQAARQAARTQWALALAHSMMCATMLTVDVQLPAPAFRNAKTVPRHSRSA
jgi:hypothetical protein